MANGETYKVHFDDGTERTLLYMSDPNPGGRNWLYRDMIVFIDERTNEDVEVAVRHIVWVSPVRQ